MSTKAPASKVDALYERLIEIQQTQAEIAREQAKAGVERDQIVVKLANMIENVQSTLKERGPVFQEIMEGVGAIPGIAGASVAEVVEKVDAKLGQRNKALVIWVGIASFLGTALGGSVHDWLGRLLP